MTEKKKDEVVFFDLVESVSVDPTDMEDGKWFTGTDITGEPSAFGWRIKIRSIAAKAVADWDRAANVKWAKLADKDGNITAAQGETRINEKIAGVLIMDWENIGVDRKPLPFSRETALKLVSDPRMIRVRAGVYNIAGALEQYKGKFLEQVEGN